jgi:hypothetical protein
LTEKITIDVVGCPKCGNPALMVPEDYSDDTIVTCPKCDYRARWADVFGEDDATDLPPAPYRTKA